MDAFYEESAIDVNSVKSAKRYKILHIVSVIFLVVAIILLVICLFNIPFGNAGASAEAQAAHEAAKFLSGFCGVQGVMFLGFWFLFYKWKSRCNVSFDYCFVSGELRISKVFNVNRRKLIARIDCEDMVQVGDIDNPSYERFKSDPTNKEIVCTPNVVAAEGKFFMYVLANYNGKKLFVLECREALLMNIMKFAKRSVLESDYVMQERKQK
ncbi:MAG: hypothetical protein IJX88_06000 [Clostridia bacterium]|nr:hypothetical protein [Clostridia bacterium]